MGKGLLLSRPRSSTARRWREASPPSLSATSLSRRESRLRPGQRSARPLDERSDSSSYKEVWPWVHDSPPSSWRSFSPARPSPGRRGLPWPTRPPRWPSTPRPGSARSTTRRGTRTRATTPHCSDRATWGGSRRSTPGSPAYGW